MKKAFILVLLFHNFSCKTTANNLTIEGRTKIRYIEMYESICCPRDYKYDIHLFEYIEAFESRNNIKIGSHYKLPLGKEGEAAYFLSLDNLSSKLQEKFVIERIKMLKTNDRGIKNYLNEPVSINQALKMWENKSINNLIKI